MYGHGQEACTDYSFIGEIWSSSDGEWGSPFDHPTNIYSDYHNLEPLFVDRENEDFRLSPNSPCIGFGKLDDNGQSTDMGAFPFTDFFNISGETKYWYNDIPIYNVQFVIMSDYLIDTTWTNSSGSYEFTNLSAIKNYTITTFKLAAENVGKFTINVYDAALCACHAVGLIELNYMQQLQ